VCTRLLGLASKVSDTSEEVRQEDGRQSNEKDRQQSIEDQSKEVFVIYGSYPDPSSASASASTSIPSIQTFTVGPNGRSFQV